MRVFLQTKDGKDIELSIDEFFRKTKTFAFGEISKGQAITSLESAIKEIYVSIKDSPPDQLNQIYAYAVENQLSYDMLVFEQFINYYSEKLNEVLCNKSLNPKYIKGYGNPSVATLSMFNILRGNEPDSIIIKGFLYGTSPNENEIYVSTTCGTGGTSQLFDTLKDRIKKGEGEWLKIEHIKLDSVESPGTINFYGKLGFYKSNKESASILRDMIKYVYSKRSYDFSKYVIKTDRIVGGTMYWFKSDKLRNKFHPKMSYEYHPELWYTNLEGIRDNKVPKKQAYKYFTEYYHKEALKGAGLTDWFKRGMDTVRRAKDKVFDIFGNTYDYTNRSKQSIIDFGNDPITKMKIARTPLFKGWDFALNLMSENRWSELKKKYGFDKLFHLSLIVTVTHNNSPTDIIIEKNERINISPDFKLSPATEYLEVPVIGKNLNITQMLSSAREAVGKQTFFEYDAFRNNCQNFIKNLLQYSGLLNPENEAFLFQDIKDIVKELPPDLPAKVKGITWLGALISKVTGKGKPKNKKLYEKVKEEVYAKNPKHSLFRSAQIVKEYKNRGGTYDNDDTEKPDMNIKKWFKQDWVSLNDLYHDNKVVPCGNSNTQEKYGEYPLCRPLKLAKKLGKEKIGKMIEEKKGPKQLQTEKLFNTDKYNIKSTVTGTGSNNNDYELHAVIFKKPYDLEQAKKEAKSFIKGKKHFYRETGTSYRFRNLPKTQFEKGSFRSKKISPDITIILGKLDK